MNPIDFKESNVWLGAGDNPGTEGMPVSKCLQNIDGAWYPSIVSKWKLSPEEIQRVQETGEIYLSVLGPGTPPVMLTPLNPFEELGFIKE